MDEAQQLARAEAELARMEQIRPLMGLGEISRMIDRSIAGEEVDWEAVIDKLERALEAARRAASG